MRSAAAHLQLRDQAAARKAYAAYLRATGRKGGWAPRLVVRTVARLGSAGRELAQQYAHAHHYASARLAAAVHDFPAARKHLAEAERTGGA